jgi:hypothetical protein
MSTVHPARRFAARSLLPIALLSLPLVHGGCVTAAMWEKLDDTRGERIAAVALTPVTVAIDAALLAGYACAAADGHGCNFSCGHGCGRGCR